MRTTIRDQLYANLITASSFSAANVFKSRYVGDNVDSDSLPIATIAFSNESRDAVSMGPTRTFQSTDDWVIRIMALPSTGDNIDETLDNLVDEVEAAMTDRTLGGNVQDCRVVAVGYAHNSEGDYNYGEVVINFQVDYIRTKAD